MVLHGPLLPDIDSTTKSRDVITANEKSYRKGKITYRRKIANRKGKDNQRELKAKRSVFSILQFRFGAFTCKKFATL